MFQIIWKWVGGCPIVADKTFFFFLSFSAGPLFFLSCLSFVVGIAMLYYYRGESYRIIKPYLSLLNFSYQCAKASKVPFSYLKPLILCSSYLTHCVHTPKTSLLLLFLPTEGETLRCTGPFLHCSAARLSKGVFIFYADVGKRKIWGFYGAWMLDSKLFISCHFVPNRCLKNLKCFPPKYKAQIHLFVFLTPREADSELSAFITLADHIISFTSSNTVSYLRLSLTEAETLWLNLSHVSSNTSHHDSHWSLTGQHHTNCGVWWG